MKYIKSLLLLTILIVPISAQAVAVLTLEDSTSAPLNPYQSDGFTLQASILTLGAISFAPNLGQSDTFNFGRNYLSVSDSAPSGAFIGSPVVNISRTNGLAFNLNSIDLGSISSTELLNLNISSTIIDSSGAVFLVNRFVSNVNELSNYVLSGFVGVTNVSISAISFLSSGPGSTEPNRSFSIDNIDITPVSVSTVPVPAAAWLFGSALLGFFGFSRRKKQI